MEPSKPILKLGNNLLAEVDNPKKLASGDYLEAHVCVNNLSIEELSQIPIKITFKGSDITPSSVDWYPTGQENYFGFEVDRIDETSQLGTYQYEMDGLMCTFEVQFA